MFVLGQGDVCVVIGQRVTLTELYTQYKAKGDVCVVTG